MKNSIILFLSVLFILSCEPATEQPHHGASNNITVKRLIVLNDQNEVLMGKVEGGWYTLSHVYNKTQYVNEAMDSLANDYGIKIKDLELRGYFSYKYEYHPYSTLRSFYVAKYVSGNIKPSGEAEEMKWMPIAEAIEKTPVESMKLGTEQILKYPDTLWGASFMVYRKGEHHHARLEEDFYPLFH